MKQERAQALVEMAIISPILILMFIGVLEVGWALRNYQILVNANREATRFLARSLYTDEQGIAHLNRAIAGQIPFEIGNNVSVYIHHVDLCAGSPFEQGDEEWEYSVNEYGPLPDLPSQVDPDTLVAAVIGLNDQVNLIQFDREVALAQAQGDTLRAGWLQAHDWNLAPVDWHCDTFVHVETPYKHEQLTHLLDPIFPKGTSMYVHTIMRGIPPRGY